MRQEMSLVRAGTVAQVALRTVDSLTLIMAAGMGWQDNRSGTLRSGAGPLEVHWSWCPLPTLHRSYA